MLSRELRRELLGVAVLALALFALLALVPIHLLGEAASGRFPSGNLVGVVGRGFRAVGLRFLGVGFGATPFLLALIGLRMAGWMEGLRALRLGAFFAGLAILIPAGVSLSPLANPWAGWVGRGVGRALEAGLGGFGAALALGVVFILLSLATLGWNPLRPLAQAVWAGGALGVRGGRSLWTRIRASRRTVPAAAKAEVPSPVRAPTPFDASPDPTPVPAKRSRASAPAGQATPESDPAPPVPQVDLFPDPIDPRERQGQDLPPIDLLTAPVLSGRRDVERELDALGEILVEKLRTFNVESQVGGRTTGPVVTQYEVIPAPGVKVNRIANLEADLALAMKATRIRIVAPIPGKGAVGVEIPNPSPESVQLREILEARAFERSKGDLPLALGKDLEGAPYVADLAKMPHALIAGATGAGKSVCLNTIITSLVYRHTPETLRLLLIDPKMVELSTYADLPHLRHPVVTDPRDAAGVLKWAVLEMERRYTLLKENGVRSLGEFNQRQKSGAVLRRVEPQGEEGDPDRWVYQEGVLPFIVLVVDELADLMMAVQSEIEKPLTLLAQKARAIGIHLIVATQRPSVNVITGLIKANFPCRIAFRVASKTDSRTILDQNGADALLGNGDMLFLPPGQGSPVRVQGAYISTADTDRVMDWFRDLREQKRAEGGVWEGVGAEIDILQLVRAAEADEGEGDSDDISGDWDELFREAAELCIANQLGSTSLLQRKLRIGYGRAARVVDQLHDAGILGPADGSKPREVLVTLDQLQRMFPNR
jgi:DNA segregation ATPase FtsK/SpoIIIE, S-DNA-T family